MIGKTTDKNSPNYFGRDGGPNSGYARSQEVLSKSQDGIFYNGEWITKQDYQLITKDMNLASVNWENIGQNASQVAQAAASISEAANALKKSGKTSENTTYAGSSSGDGDVLGTLIPIVIGLFLFGR